MISFRLPFFVKTGILLLAFALMSGSVWAQEEPRLQLEDEPLGAYRLSVWTAPEPPRVGALHVTAALNQADSGDPATSPVITIYARAPYKDVIEAKMTPGQDATPALYAATLDIPYTANWTIEVAVKDGDWEGRASFPLEIQPAPINKNLIRLGAFATLVVLISGWWFWGRHPRKKRVRKRIFMPRPDEDN